MESLSMALNMFSKGTVAE